MGIRQLTEPIVVRAQVYAVRDERGGGLRLELVRPDDEHADGPRLLGSLHVGVGHDVLRRVAVDDLAEVAITFPARAVGAIPTDAIATDAVHGGGVGGS